MTRTSEGDRPADWTAPGTYEVAPSVYRIPLPLPSDGLRAVNVYAIDHGDGLTLIDAGWAVAQTTPALESGLAALGRAVTDISRILVTHVHRDHYSYAVLLRERWGTHIALGAGEADTLRAVRRMGEGEQENSSLPRLRAAGAADLAAAIAAGSRPPHTLEFWQPPDEWLTGGQQIALPGRVLESISTPGHTRGHLVYRDAAARALFAGDHILSRITPSIGFEAAPSPSPLAAYLRSLALVRDCPTPRCCPRTGRSPAASTRGSTDCSPTTSGGWPRRRPRWPRGPIPAGRRPAGCGGPGGSASSTNSTRSTRCSPCWRPSRT